MKISLLGSIAALLALGLGHAAQGQTVRADTSLVATATRSLRQHYARALGSELRLYDGPEYVNYGRTDTKGSRFFASPEAQPATITYGGFTYTDVPLRYDLVRGQLVVPAQVGGLSMLLVNEKVARFHVSGHTFVRLLADSSAGSPLRTGFYDLLVEGPVRLLAARHKTIQKRSVTEGVESEITASNEYFVGKDHRYYPVSKGADVLRLFPQDKAALRQYSRDNNLNFKPEGRELALTALVSYLATRPAASH